jgi:plasmid rolling circle replication initiator protein Rep
MDMSKSQEVIILVDKDSKGKEKPWRSKKFMSLKLSESYKRIADKVSDEYEKRGVHMRCKRVRRRIGEEVKVFSEPMGLYDSNSKRVVNYEKRAGNVKFCGTHLEFKPIDEEIKRLIKANFCRVPLCPMCQWRKSLRIFRDVSEVMRVVQLRKVNYVPLFLTLTVRNCSIEDLKITLDNMFKAWNEFLKHKLRVIVKGWFRSLEVTYDGDKKITPQRYREAKKYYDERGLKQGDVNPNYNTIHPHFHAILFVERTYFKSDYYMETRDWVKLWRQSARLDYDPVCDIRRVKTSKEKKNQVSDIAKYVYKDAEILTDKLSEKEKDDVVQSLSSAFHGRRLYAYGGIMKEIAAELRLDEDKMIDDNDEINPELAKMILTYRWDFGISNYRFVKDIKVEEAEKGADK